MKHKTFSAFTEQIALGTSVVFSPFIVPIVAAVFIVHKHASTTEEGLLWLIVVAIFVTVLPISVIVLLFRFSKVSNVHLHAKEERLLPLSLTLVSMILGNIVLYLIGANEKIIWVCQAYIVNSVVFTVITPFWKISFHTSAAAGCITVLALFVNMVLVWLFLFVPLIAWARIYRKRHTFLQTVMGTLLAIVNTMLYYYFLPPSV